MQACREGIGYVILGPIKSRLAIALRRRSGHGESRKIEKESPREEGCEESPQANRKKERQKGRPESSKEGSPQNREEGRKKAGQESCEEGCEAGRPPTAGDGSRRFLPRRDSGR
jgi:hypothetical protein